MEAGAVILLGHVAGCVAASGVMQWQFGFERRNLWWFLLCPASIPASLVLLPYAAWKSWHDRPELRGRRRSLLVVMSVRLWIGYLVGAACMIVALRLAAS
jgi:hypothetical protein